MDGNKEGRKSRSRGWVPTYEHDATDCVFARSYLFELFRAYPAHAVFNPAAPSTLPICMCLSEQRHHPVAACTFDSLPAYGIKPSVTRVSSSVKFHRWLYGECISETICTYCERDSPSSSIFPSLHSKNGSIAANNAQKILEMAGEDQHAAIQSTASAVDRRTHTHTSVLGCGSLRLMAGALLALLYTNPTPPRSSDSSLHRQHHVFVPQPAQHPNLLSAVSCPL